MNKEIFEIPVVPKEGKSQQKEEKQKKTLLDRLEAFGRLDSGMLSKNFYFLLFVAGLALVHIANNHMAENYIRKVNAMEKEIKELRWNYMTEKSELMQQSMQSEVADMVAPLGLEELKTPPYKIEIDPKHYE